VAGTGSHKPYLFNADNVARHAPPAWHSADTVIDSSYEALDRLARSPRAVPAVPPGTLAGMAEPPLLPQPTASLPEVPRAALAGASVWLVHPWALRAPPAHWPAHTLRLAWWPRHVHAARPWSAARWAFVQRGWAALATHTLDDEAALADAAQVGAWADPHVDDALPASVQRLAAEPLFPPVQRPCSSFSQWWAQALRGVSRLDELPGCASLSAGPLFD
jgi:deoxyribodipyrimidine photo-lyase